MKQTTNDNVEFAEEQKRCQYIGNKQKKKTNKQTSDVLFIYAELLILIC